MKKYFYSIIGVLLMAAPLVAEAQWSSGRMYAGQSGLPAGSIFGIIRSTMNWLLAILGFLGIIGFVIAGILYLTAAGDEGQIDRAKTATTYSIIGVIVALLGFVIILAVEAWLNQSRSF